MIGWKKIGNICAGKTTLSKQLGELYGSKVFYEPATKNPFLEKFYKEPKKYAFRLQIWLLKYRYKTYNEALMFMKKEKKGIILDRSIFSDYVFAKQVLLDGFITKEQFETYLDLREKMMGSVPLPDHIVYLNVSVDECHQRIHNIRKRKEEIATGIPKSYLAGLENCYHELIEQMHEKGINVVKLDWNYFGKAEKIVDLLQPPHLNPNNQSDLSEQIMKWEFNLSTFLELQRFSVNSEWDNDYKDLEIIQLN